MIKYRDDFYGWTQEQAKSLRAGLWDVVDAEQLAEEIETLTRSEENALASYFEVLLRHLQWAAHQHGGGRVGGGASGPTPADREADSTKPRLGYEEASSPRPTPMPATTRPMRPASRSTASPRMPLDASAGAGEGFWPDVM